VIGSLDAESGPCQPTANTDVSSTLKDWVKYTNAHGGISGHPVKVDALDDACNPGTGLTNAHTLINDHVLAILDNDVADAAWFPAVLAAKIPIICGTQNANGFTCSSTPTAFPSGGTVLPELYGDFAAAKAAGAKSVAEVYCTESPQCKQSLPVYAGFTKALGLKNLTPLAASESAPSYTAQCVSMQQAGAQAVFPAGPPSVKLAGDCAQQGFKPTYIEASGTWENSFLTDSNLQNAVGSVCEVPWTVTNTPATEAFRAATGNLISTSFSPYNVITAWSSAQLFAVAAAKLRSAASPTGVLNALDSIKGETLGGFSPPLTFTAGKAHTVPYYYEMSIKGGKWVSPNGGAPVKVALFTSS
jgi:branched-chain amino acid transport system substrate-binding protein